MSMVKNLPNNKQAFFDSVVWRKVVKNEHLQCKLNKSVTKRLLDCVGNVYVRLEAFIRVLDYKV